MACEVAPPTAPTTIPTNNPTEAWKVLYNNPTLKGRVDLQWKTRLDPYATVLDSSLYSPIIYQFEHELTVEGQVPNVIIVKPVVVYDDDNSTHLRALNKDNEMILKGDLEIAMTRHKQTNTFRGHSKIQFTDSSYHHDRKSFRLIWNYSINTTTTTNVVNADNSAEQLLHSVISTPFKVFARKPSKKEAATTAATTTTTTAGKKGSKRKNLEEDDHSGHSTSSDSNSTNSLNVDRVTPTAETDNNQNNNSPVKKVKREVIEVVDEEQPQPTKLPSTNLLTYDLHRTVPSLVNSVTTAVLTHLCKENTQQDLVIELLKQLTDINSRLERLEKMSTTTHLDENPTPNNVNSHHHHGHHHHHHNLQHA